MRLDAPIKELTFADGQTLKLRNDSIVVFVGPNNAGKTTCLRDIYCHLSGDSNCNLVSSIDFTKPSIEDVKSLLNEIAIEKHDPLLSYEGMGFRISDYDMGNYSKFSYYPKSIKEMLFHFLTTETRLSACFPQKSVPRKDPATGPIALLARDSSYLEKVSSAFHSAFSLEVIPNYFNGGEIPLCLGSTPVAPKDMPVPQINDFMYETLSSYPLAHHQGDGMRSFLGIVLFIYANQYTSMFIDEPESFLHPPQAKLMGSLIASNETSGRQLFISTHSKELLNGMLESGPDRIQVVRITRANDVNDFALLDVDDISKITSNTLLKYSDLINSLFHERTVLCESDSDCMFYQLIWDTVRASEPTPLFLPVGGKGRFKTYVDLLSKLHIDYSVVADADILRNPTDIKGVLLQDNVVWESIKSDWETINQELGSDEGLSVASLKAEIDEVFKQCKGPTFSKTNCGKIRKLLESKSRWDEMKRHGINALSGGANKACKRIVDTLSHHNVQIVPVGELECFVPSIDSHGPSWVNDVLQEYPDLNDEVYDIARDFISSW